MLLRGKLACRWDFLLLRCKNTHTKKEVMVVVFTVLHIITSSVFLLAIYFLNTRNIFYHHKKCFCLINVFI